MNLKAIIVDDEPLAIKLLEKNLSEFDFVDVVATCKNGREVIEKNLELVPDLLFLDIQMPGLNGFDIVKAIQSETMPMIIFVTAYEQFAVDAFEVHAIDYLLKPVEPQRLLRALLRARTTKESGVSLAENKDNLIAAIEVIADRVRETQQDGTQPVASPPVESSEVRKISIKDGDTVTVVEEADIDWIDAAGDYMCIHIDGVTHIMRSTMHDLLDRLDPNTFKRIHRSTVVNINRIQKVQRHTKGEFFLHLDCDHTLKASRHYKDVIKAFISQTQ